MKAIVGRKQTREPTVNYSNEARDNYHTVLVHTEDRKHFRDLLLGLPHVTEDVATHADLIGSLVALVCEQQKQILALERSVADFISGKVLIAAADNWQRVLSQAVQEGYHARGASIRIEAEATQEISSSSSNKQGNQHREAANSAASVAAGLSGAVSSMAKLKIDANHSKEALEQSIHQITSDIVESASARRRLVYEARFEELAAPKARKAAGGAGEE